MSDKILEILATVYAHNKSVVGDASLDEETIYNGSICSAIPFQSSQISYQAVLNALKTRFECIIADPSFSLVDSKNAIDLLINELSTITDDIYRQDVRLKELVTTLLPHVKTDSKDGLVSDLVRMLGAKRSGKVYLGDAKAMYRQQYWTNWQMALSILLLVAMVFYTFREKVSQATTSIRSGASSLLKNKMY